MKLSRLTPSFLTFLTIILAMLLVVLATLQYQWVGQVSQSEHERLHGNLILDMIHFAEDFDREITRVFITFQMNAAPLEQGNWTEIVDRCRLWQKTAPYPNLVQEVYVVRSTTSNQLRLFRYDQNLDIFTESPWPHPMKELRNRFEEQLRVVTSHSEQILTFAVPAIAEEIPALVVPLSTIQYRGDGRGLEFTQAFGYTVVTLNQDCIKRELIPTLAKRTLNLNNDTGYQMTVVSRKNAQDLIYQSHPQARFTSATGDASYHIFSVQFTKFSNLLRETQLLSRNFTQSGTGPEPPVSVSLLKQATGETFVGAMPPINDENGRWDVVLKHSAGSLEAMVQRTRRRNLFLSFGVLTVLAVSLAVTLVATKRAQHLAEQQMAFVAGVSHELRTPLSVICSAADNLAVGVVAKPERVVKYGETIRREGLRLTEMVEQVLEFAGVQSGRKSYSMQPVDVGQLIGSALLSIGPLLKEQGFQLETRIDEHLPLIMGDYSALERVLQNLLTNAMKYSGDSRWIGLTVQTENNSTPHILLTVADKGMGIAREELPYIFDRFFRGRGAKEFHIRGSGLGLTLVKHIIEAHGGKIEVTSRVQEGSQFQIALPITSEPVETQEIENLSAKF
ncbi:MAG: hypothetical protein K1Y36_15195 [Blastocatellia bacterium]|nr:hypothetical protein [Blastocatellia bacterium]